MKTRTDQAGYANQILSDLKTLDADEMMSLHGIMVNEDKTVYDQAYDQTFADVAAWIAFSSEDEDNAFEKFGYDDMDYI